MPSISRRGLAALGLAGLPAAAWGQPAPRLFALLVGIDSYPFIRPLRGCVNDARAIETATRPIATRVTLLLEADATRGAFLGQRPELIASGR